jgi:hypothetical protein
VPIRRFRHREWRQALVRVIDTGFAGHAGRLSPPSAIRKPGRDTSGRPIGYYFRIKDVAYQDQSPILSEFEALDSDEGQLLTNTYALSLFDPRKK